MGPSHVLIALTGAVLIASQTTTDYREAGILIGGSVATAKLPDIDQAIPGVRHRGPVTHSLFTGLLYSAVLLAVGSAIHPVYGTLAATGMAIGWLLHPPPDNLTKTGTWWLWPFVRREIRWLPKRFAFYTGTPKRTKTWPRRCERCRKLAAVCWCGKPELLFRAVLMFGLAGFLWVTYGG